MTFDATEKSRDSAAPIEGLKFVWGGTTWRFTQAESNIVLPDGTFVVEPGLSRGQVTLAFEDQSNAMTVTVRRENAIAALFAVVSPSPPPLVTLYAAHRGAESEATVAWTGMVAGANLYDDRAELLCAPLSTRLERTIPSVVYQIQCNWALFSPECGVSLAAFRVTGSVSSFSGNFISATAFGTKPTNWFRGGFAKLASGAEHRFIIANSGSQLELAIPFTTLTIGTNVEASAGCDRSFAECGTKFNNADNHGGFPDLVQRNPHDPNQTLWWRGAPPRRSIGVGR